MPGPDARPDRVDDPDDLVTGRQLRHADHSDVIREAVRQSLAKWTDAIAAVLTEARDAGIRADLDPRATAGFIVNAWEGSLSRARADRSTDAFESFFVLIFDAFLVETRLSARRG